MRCWATSDGFLVERREGRFPLFSSHALLDGLEERVRRILERP